jgi:UPF0042 nucleotide-binding protein
VRCVVISGLSGAGKRTALQSLEEAGYFVTDNLPPPLWGPLYRILEEEGGLRLAVSIDGRTQRFLKDLPAGLAQLRERGRTELLYLEAGDEVLLRRYNLTRRSHPLGDSSLLVDFEQERHMLAPLRELADTVLDTTELSAQQLGQRVLELYGQDAEFTLSMISFGFKFGPPRDADLVLDVRSLPNPYYLPQLKERSGLEAEVAAYVFGRGAQDLYLPLRDFVRRSCQAARAEGRRSYTVAVGCTGGRHRSVAVCERLRSEVSDLGYVSVHHRDLDREGAP